VHELQKSVIDNKKMPRCAIGDACLFPDLPLEGRHCCAICKNQLHGPCGIFNGDDSSITYRNHCYSCKSPSNKVADVAATTAIATLTSNIQIPEATTAVGDTQQSAPMTAKDIDAKAVSWGNIDVGDGPLKSGEMVKSALTICGMDAMASNTEQLRQICVALKIQGYRSKPTAEVLRIMAVAKLHQNFYEGEQDPSSKEQDKTPVKTRNCVFGFSMFYSVMKWPLN
jgi:hypothetical protein